MLKLKHLVEDFNLAEIILKHWPYDDNALDLFQYFRISSNAIYPYKHQGEVRFLRFAPASEKNMQAVAAEMDFIAYLKCKGFNALEAVPTCEGAYVIQAETPQGSYVATGFKRVPGDILSDCTITTDLAKQMGNKLGALHVLSCQYKPAQAVRPDFEERLDWMALVLTQTGAPLMLNNELESLRRALLKMPRNDSNYGLIHYDFEPDNLFYDKANDAIHVIDFDDCMVHFYAQDLERALHALKSETADSEHPALEQAFIEAYQSQMVLDESIWQHRPVFERFGQLYQYCRMRYALHEPLMTQPDWMEDMVLRLSGRMSAFETQLGTI